MEDIKQIKKWLNRANEKKKEIRILKDIFYFGFDESGKIQQTVQINNLIYSGGDTTNYIIDRLYIESVIIDKYAQLYEIKTELLTFIESIPIPIYRIVLLQEYINGKTPPQIAKENKCCKRLAQLQIQQALQYIVDNKIL